MRLIQICLIVLICFLLSVTVYADDNLELTGPEEIYPRETFEIVLVINCADITKIVFDLDMDQENLQLQALWANNPAWVYQPSAYTYVFERSQTAAEDEQIVFRARLRVISSEDGIRAWFKMKNVVLWSGDTSWQIDDILWERMIEGIVSDNSYLTSLQISDAVLSPEFSPYQQSYTATVPHFVAQVSVNAVTMDDGASVTVDSPVLEYGKTSQVTVTVKAEDQSVRVYTIAVTREDSPDRIPSSNCDLEKLEVTDYLLSPQFQPEITEYVLWLPYETTGVQITATPADAMASVTVVGNKGFEAGCDNPIYVTCTAEDGTQKVYRIIAKRAQAYLPQPSETVPMPAATVNGAVYAAEPDIPAWVYVVVAVAAVTGCAAVGILITDRKK